MYVSYKEFPLITSTHTPSPLTVGCHRTCYWGKTSARVFFSWGCWWHISNHSVLQRKEAFMQCLRKPRQPKVSSLLQPSSISAANMKCSCLICLLHHWRLLFSFVEYYSSGNLALNLANIGNPARSTKLQAVSFSRSLIVHNHSNNKVTIMGVKKISEKTYISTSPTFQCCSWYPIWPCNSDFSFQGHTLLLS